MSLDHDRCFFCRSVCASLSFSDSFDSNIKRFRSCVAFSTASFVLVCRWAVLCCDANKKINIPIVKRYKTNQAAQMNVKEERDFVYKNQHMCVELRAHKRIICRSAFSLSFVVLFGYTELNTHTHKHRSDGVFILSNFVVSVHTSLLLE